jgi:hypothetical protein|tara:strand:- start:206 stop:718 length:513 start_codon:yes stop_codon:yes gene_type:complete
MKFKKIYQQAVERALSISAFIFPFLELNYYFGAKVFMGTESVPIKYLWVSKIAKFAMFYEKNVYLVFIVMVAVFITCSRGTIPLTKYVRFNVIQAILLNILTACAGQVYTYLPLFMRETNIGLILANSIYVSVALTMGYCIIHIAYGKYPRLPVVSEGARLQVQRGYLDD